MAEIHPREKEREKKRGRDMEEEGRDGVRVEKKRQRGERKDTKAGDHKSP